jgi:5,10-methylenetetrahydromethanopterin reductase
MSLKYGVGMGRRLAITEILPHVTLAEALGYEHVTFIDSQGLSRDSVAMMTLAAANTHRLRIGHGVTQPYTRHMSVLANSVATVDELSGGRAFLGIAAGGSSLGVMGRQPGTMAELEEAIQFFRDYTGGEKATWQGTTMHSEWIRRRIPVIIGADGPKSLRLAGRVADGVFAPGLRRDLIGWRRKRVTAGAEAAGKSAGDVEYWVRTMICVNDDLDYARSQVRSYACTCAYQFYYGALRWKTDDAEELKSMLPGRLVDEIFGLGQRYDWYQHELTAALHSAEASDELIDSFVIFGPPRRCIEKLEEITSVGVDRVSMTLYTIRDKKTAMRRFVEEVYPHLR